jgi:peptidoglycan/xylan/chitin deacetylase (PgdA/CDA1 family)
MSLPGNPSLSEQLRPWLRIPARTLPFPWLRALGGLKLLLPFYHLVSDDDPVHVRHLYPVRSTRQFREDLDFLGKHYRSVSLEEVIHHQRHGIPFRRWSVHLTVDDGLRECSDVMAPILWEKGFHATFFLNSAFLDNRSLMFRYQASLLAEALGRSGPADFDPLAVPYADRETLERALSRYGVSVEDFLEKERPYMTSRQVGKLLEKGFAVGSHSVDHPLYRQLSESEQLRQTVECQDFLEKKFGLPYRVFAFPFTDDGVGSGFLDRLHREHRFQLTFGTAGMKRDEAPYHLQRLPMEKTGHPARTVLGMAHAQWAAKALVNRNTVRRKA